jgi:release factor glutamine methyltransferase
VTDLAAMLRAATEQLAAAGVPTPRVDAELLAAHVWGLSPGRWRALLWTATTPADDDGPRRERFAALVAARADRVPLQHLTGTAPFRGLVLAVGPGVFIPRPETEVTAGWAIAVARARPRARVADLGTGSGAIAAAVAAELPHAEVVAVERDPAALAWARRNLDSKRVRLVAGDATDPALDLGGPFDVVVSNPPYIPDGMVPIDPEVARHDPPAALYGGGADGLEVPAGIVQTAARLLVPGGTLVMEHGERQGAATRRLAEAAGFTEIATRPDLAGRDRVLTAIRA